MDNNIIVGKAASIRIANFLCSGGNMPSTLLIFFSLNP